MNQSSLSRAFLLAGMLAGAGFAQAETYDSPSQAGEASTMTMGAPNQLTTNSPYSDNAVVVDTTVLGAPPASVGSSYGEPDAVVTHVHRPVFVSPNAAAATFDVPARAGEASTMTGGAPNMVTSNEGVLRNSRDPVVIHN